MLNVEAPNARTFVTAVQSELAASTRAHWRTHSGRKSCVYGSDGGSHDEFIVVMITISC